MIPKRLRDKRSVLSKIAILGCSWPMYLLNPPAGGGQTPYKDSNFQNHVTTEVHRKDTSTESLKRNVMT